ncbi:MAG: hypothetical protein AAFU77_07935 [Myxococcota bacterium]
MELLATAFLVNVSFAQALPPIPGEERFKSMLPADGEASGDGAAEIGFGQIDEDYFIKVQLRTDFNLGKVGVGLAIPLNLRIIDEDPENNDDFYGVIRREDYDQTFDYLRVIRYLRYGQKRDPVYFRIGELAAQIGHGTIMSRYVNNLDLNTYRLGLELDVNTDYGGVETMVGDFGSVFSDKNGSRLVGFRGYVKPVAFSDPESFWNIFAVGMSWVADLNAPTLIQTADDGSGSFVPVTEDGALVAEEDVTQGIFGIDAEAELVNNALLSVIPYTDLNFIGGAGWGWHLGVNVTFKVPVIVNLQFPVRLEYRNFRNNYRPIYFSSFYEVERYDYLAEDTSGVRDLNNPEDAARSTPKAEFVRSLSDEGGINGYFADAALDLVGIAQLGAVYEDYEGGDPNLAVYLNVPALEFAQFKAFYTKTGITDIDDLATLDDRSYAVAQAKVAIASPLFLVARFTRQWQLNTISGEYDSIDNWNTGFEIQFQY